MSTSNLDRRFFESTRGRIVVLLRTEPRTVNDIAERLGLTDNAVRAQLLALERDGLVEQAGMLKGFRKPHSLYGLTPGAARLFPRSYGSLLAGILATFKRRLKPPLVEDVLAETGREMGSRTSASLHGSLDVRLNRAVVTLGELGGAASVVEEDSTTMIKSNCCPFGEVVNEHPEICKLAESLVSEIVGEPVEEKCDRGPVPKCRFLIRNA